MESFYKIILEKDDKILLAHYIHSNSLKFHDK